MAKTTKTTQYTPMTFDRLRTTMSDNDYADLLQKLALTSSCAWVTGKLNGPGLDMRDNAVISIVETMTADILTEDELSALGK